MRLPIVYCDSIKIAHVTCYTGTLSDPKADAHLDLVANSVLVSIYITLHLFIILTK